MTSLDKTDVAILDVLRDNARLSTREISRKSGVPPATVYNRMKKMEEEKLIEGYTVLLNKAKLGKDTSAYILIRAKPGADHSAIMKDLQSNPAVEDIGAVSGEFDIIVKVCTSGIKELDHFIFEYLRKFPDVTQTQTMLIFRSGNWK
ncbi:Lrp/AsnC family transcriptional regulator [Candidatus Micrarchaeota archaeon]|nr:Lrp/AsnC family transcriptional regulator [Candidatus Micrarchaeota archaeon]